MNSLQEVHLTRSTYSLFQYSPLLAMCSGINTCTYIVFLKNGQMGNKCKKDEPEEMKILCPLSFIFRRTKKCSVYVFLYACINLKVNMCLQLDFIHVLIFFQLYF